MGGYSFHHEGQRIDVDISEQVIRAEVDDKSGRLERPAEVATTTATTKTTSGISLLDLPETWPSPVHPSVADTTISEYFTPLMALALKAKAFDDRLVATVERLAHDGIGPKVGLYHWMAELRRGVELGSPARALLDAAAHLKGDELPDDRRAALLARRQLATFTGDEKASKPIGFYAKSDYLRRVFQHDRILQQPLSQDDGTPLRQVFLESPGLLAAYRSHLELMSRLTGPLADPSVLDPSAREVALLPASDSIEGRLIKSLFGNRSIPDGFQLGPELVARIRAGQLPTEPSDDDGWYAHQFHAIAALLQPERDGLEVGPRYHQALEETFQALFALTRETHVKQLEVPMGAGAPLRVRPRITVEPVPAYYGRVADGYRFLGQQLTTVLGDRAMASPIDQSPLMSLGDAIVEMELLFRGAEAACYDELGRPTSAPNGPAARAVFRSWQPRSPGDPDLATDLRVAVPVYYDVERETVRICVTLGVETSTLRLEFVQRPTVEIHGETTSRFGPQDPLFVPTEGLILSPITIECDVRVPPTRDELRAICDQHKDPAAIKHALEANH